MNDNLNRRRKIQISRPKENRVASFAVLKIDVSDESLLLSKREISKLKKRFSLPEISFFDEVEVEEGDDIDEFKVLIAQTRERYQVEQMSETTETDLLESVLGIRSSLKGDLDKGELQQAFDKMEEDIRGQSVNGEVNAAWFQPREATEDDAKRFEEMKRLRDTYLMSDQLGLNNGDTVGYGMKKFDEIVIGKIGRNFRGRSFVDIKKRRSKVHRIRKSETLDNKTLTRRKSQKKIVRKVSSGKNDRKKKERTIPEEYENLGLVLEGDHLVGCSWVGLIEFYCQFDNKKDANKIGKSIIYGHRNFIKSKKILKIIAKLYKSTKNELQMRERLLHLVELWLELIVDDFLQVPLVQTFKRFISNVSLSNLNASRNLLECFKSSLQRNEDKSYLEASPPIYLSKRERTDPSYFQIENVKEMNILDFRISETARQITLIDQLYMRKLKISNLQLASFDEKKVTVLSQMRDQFDTVSRWVATEIVQQPVLFIRVRVLMAFITLCEKLKMLQNYNSYMAVYTGLSQWSVARMKGTWKSISSSSKKSWKQITSDLNPKDRFENLRKLETCAGPPKIVSTALLYMTLTHLHDTLEDTIGRYMNYSKIQLFGQVIERVTQSQYAYPMKPHPILQSYLNDPFLFTLEELEHHSLLIEPQPTI